MTQYSGIRLCASSWVLGYMHAERYHIIAGAKLAFPLSPSELIVRERNFEREKERYGDAGSNKCGEQRD